MQLTIESVKTNPSGKSLMVKAGGKDYFAKTNSGIQAGITIEAETEISEYNGKSNIWIKKWKAIAAAAPAAIQTQQTGTSGSAWLPFASNTVAHAINAGLIQNPEQVKAWAAAAKQAYVDLA